MIISTLGLESSASTWCYNVVRGLADLKSGRVFATQSHDLAGLQPRLYIDDKIVLEILSREMNQPDVIVIKGHNIINEMLWLLRAAHAKFILTIRNGPDSLASIITRLGENEQAWAPNLARSLASIYTCLHRTDCLLLTYESRFFERRETLLELAQFLGVQLDDQACDRIFQQYTRARVHEFVQALDKLPEERKLRDHANRLSDSVTQFNQRHVGDARSGKWRETINPLLHGVVARMFEGADGRKALDSSFCLRFHEAIFSPVAIDHATSYEVQASEPWNGDRTFLLMRGCYLPMGRWRMTLRGGFPSGTNLRLNISHHGETVFAQAIAQENLAAFEFVFDLDIVKFDEPVDIRVFGAGLERLEPLRTNALELEARFLAHI